MITLSKYEVETLSPVCELLVKNFDEDDFDTMELWRQNLALGDRIVRNVLVVRLRKGDAMYLAPIWPEDEQAPSS